MHSGKGVSWANFISVQVFMWLFSAKLNYVTTVRLINQGPSFIKMLHIVCLINDFVLNQSRVAVFLFDFVFENSNNFLTQNIVNTYFIHIGYVKRAVILYRWV